MTPQDPPPRIGEALVVGLIFIIAVGSILAYIARP